jgi:hypothetical protein
MPDDSTPYVSGPLDQVEDRLTACEVLHWIAFRELKTLEKYLQDDYLVMARWGFAFDDKYLEALEARISLNPYCPVHRLEGNITVTTDGVDVSNDRMGHYQHPAYSPQGPRYLRYMRATVRRRLGRLISYQDLCVELREELARSKAHMNALDAAGTKLIKMVRAKELDTIIGQRDIRGESPPAGVDYEEIPLVTFEHPAIKITFYNRVTMDVNRPVDEWRGSRTRSAMSVFRQPRYSRSGAPLSTTPPYRQPEIRHGGSKEPLTSRSLRHSSINFRRIMSYRMTPSQASS